MATGKISKARAATNASSTATVPAEQVQVRETQVQTVQVQTAQTTEVTPLPFPVSVAGGSITAVAPPAPPPNVSEPAGKAAYAERSIAHIDSEVAALEAKSKGIQEEMQAKTKELATLKETLLVVSGALQGLGHMRQYFDGERRSESESLSGALVGNLNK